MMNNKIEEVLESQSYFYDRHYDQMFFGKEFKDRWKAYLDVHNKMYDLYVQKLIKESDLKVFEEYINDKLKYLIEHHFLNEKRRIKPSQKTWRILHYIQATRLSKMIGKNMVQEILELRDQEARFFYDLERFWKIYKSFLYVLNRFYHYLNEFEWQYTPVIKRGYLIFEEIIRKYYEDHFPSQTDNFCVPISQLKTQICIRGKWKINSKDYIFSIIKE